MKGRVMKTVASAIPGTAKMIFRSRAFNGAANHPWVVLKISTKSRPAITGDTAKGRSSTVTRRLLPR